MSLACDDGYYGLNCSGECGNCSKGDMCRKENGVCPYGCQDGFVGEMCTTAQEGKIYGENSNIQ